MDAAATLLKRNVGVLVRSIKQSVVVEVPR